MSGRGGKRTTSFKAGRSGNPGGRPKLAPAVAKAFADVKSLAKDVGAKAVATLEAVMDDVTMPPAVRVAAANSLLDRGYGKPKQTVDVNDTTAVSWLDLVKASMRPDVEARVRPLVETYALPPPEGDADEPD